MSNVKTFCAIIFLGVSSYCVLYYLTQKPSRPTGPKSWKNGDQTTPTVTHVDFIHSMRDAKDDDPFIEQMLQEDFTTEQPQISTDRSQGIGGDMLPTKIVSPVHQSFTNPDAKDNDPFIEQMLQEDFPAATEQSQISTGNSEGIGTRSPTKIVSPVHQSSTTPAPEITAFLSTERSPTIAEITEGDGGLSEDGGIPTAVHMTHQLISSRGREIRTFMSTERPQTTTASAALTTEIPTTAVTTQIPTKTTTTETTTTAAKAPATTTLLPTETITTAAATVITAAAATTEIETTTTTATPEISEPVSTSPTTLETTFKTDPATTVATRPLVIPEGPMTLPGLLVKFDAWFAQVNLNEDTPCPQFPEGGRIPVRKESVTLDEVERELPFVETGGRWQPKKCQAKRKVAIVIPFRDRQEHLNIFLRHMHAFLKLQLLDYRIFVAEQAGPETFNRGILMNIGFVEARKVHNFDCVVFHDVDLLPEDTRNAYSCPTSPRHMCPQVSTLQYRLLYATLFGGVEGLSTEHFVRINGFPNRYWGWGGEDDDLYKRIARKGLRLTRPADHAIGRYTMLSHGHDTGYDNPDRFNQLNQANYHADSDGLNSLSYDVLSTDELPLYTLITARPHRH